MGQPASDELHASRFGWFSAGVISAVAILAAFFFLGDYIGATDGKANAPDQIIVGQ